MEPREDWNYRPEREDRSGDEKAEPPTRPEVRAASASKGAIAETARITAAAKSATRLETTKIQTLSFGSERKAQHTRLRREFCGGRPLLRQVTGRGDGLLCQLRRFSLLPCSNLVCDTRTCLRHAAKYCGGKKHAAHGAEPSAAGGDEEAAKTFVVSTDKMSTRRNSVSTLYTTCNGSVVLCFFSLA